MCCLLLDSLSDLTLQQVTLSLCLGRLGIYRAKDMVCAAYFGSYSDMKALFFAFCKPSGIRIFLLVGETLAQHNFTDLLPPSF